MSKAVCKDPKPRTKVPAVLVVDDESSIIEIFEDVVAGGVACRMLKASSMAEARKVLTGAPIDLLVADVGLPDGNGMELLEELRLTSPNAAAIFMTQKPSVDGTLYALRHGVIDYLPKPFSATQICERVSAALKQQAINVRNDRRLTRLKHAVRELNKARRVVSQKVDLLCNDLINAYSDVAQQMQTVRTEESFRNTLNGAGDMEQMLCHAMDWLLKQIGYSNIAVWLAGDGDKFELGAYMKYTIVGEAKVTGALEKAIVPTTVRQGTVRLSAVELSHVLAPADRKTLAGQSLLSVSCSYLGESLAVIAAFRDEKSPFRDEDMTTLRSIASVFATKLTAAVHANDETDAEEGMIDDTPWADDEPKKKNPKKPQNDADWWKTGGPPPF